MGSNILNEITVLGGAHNNGLGIIRSLGEAGYQTFFISIGSKKNYVRKSKYIIFSWYAENEKMLLQALLREFNDSTLPPILIPSDDNSTSILDRNFNFIKRKIYSS